MRIWSWLTAMEASGGGQTRIEGNGCSTVIDCRGNSESSRATGLLALLLFAAAAVGAATESLVESVLYSVPRTETPVNVDAVLDDPAWVGAARIPLRFETRPGENTAPPVDTVCLLSYDSSHVYVAFRAYDAEPEAIRARIVDRDTAWDDDFVGARCGSLLSPW